MEVLILDVILQYMVSASLIKVKLFPIGCIRLGIFDCVQVTFGYGEFTVKGHAPIKNVIIIPNAVFTEEEDPTRYNNIS